MNSNTKKNYSACKNKFKAGLLCRHFDRKSNRPGLRRGELDTGTPEVRPDLDHADSLTAVP
jgi:hypothetical protein